MFEWAGVQSFGFWNLNGVFERKREQHKNINPLTEFVAKTNDLYFNNYP